MRGGLSTRVLAVARALSCTMAAPRVQLYLRRSAGVAMVAVFCAMLLSLWHPVFRFTQLLQVDRHNEPRLMAVLRTQPVVLNDGGYDGQYYAQLACDPTLRSPDLTNAIDSLSYRARRILLPAVAWTLGLGNPGSAVAIYPWLNIACWLVLAVLLWPLLEADMHWRGLLAWGGVLFSAGSLASVRYALTDLPALLLLVLAMRAATAGREGRMAAWLGASLLTRETVLAGAWGLCSKAWDWSARWMRGAMWIALAVVPFALWMVYVKYRVGNASSGSGNFAMPLVGLARHWRDSIAWLGTCPEPWLAWSSLLALVAVTAQLVFVLTHVDVGNRWWRLGAGFALLMVVLGDAVWEGYLGATTRVLLPLLLACNMMAIRCRWAPLWILLLNLSVPGGVSDMRLAIDGRMFAASRSGEIAATMEVGAGCYGLESLGRDRWTWTAQDAECPLRIWGDAQHVAVALELRIRAIDSRELVISCGGRELWRGQVGTTWQLVRLPPFSVGANRGALTLHATQPGLYQEGGYDARLLSICLLNPRLEIDRR